MGNIRKPLATHRARGLTLVEMLMATALTLIMFAAVAQIFGMMGGAMQDARATIELSGNLRSVTNHLQRDLDNLTVEVKPWVQPGSNQGYFEIIEGPDRDVDFAAVDVIPDMTDHQGALGGDADDILCFTAYSKDEPFVGLIQGRLRDDNLGSLPYKYWIDRSDPTQFTAITSQYAEVVYFTKHTQADDRNLYVGLDNPSRRDANETVTVYRRVLLIRPDIYLGNPSSMTPPASYQLSYAEAMNYYDLSMWASIASPSGASQWMTNSLEDLQDRYRRVAHNPITADGLLVDEDDAGNNINLSIGNTNFPFPLRPHALLSFEQLNRALSLGPGNDRDRTGEDVILTRALAFDVKVFDPGAIVKQEAEPGTTLAVVPGDRDYGNASGVFSDSSMTGAFVDLNWSRTTGTTGSVFFDTPNSKSGLNNIAYNSNSLFGSTPVLPQLNTTFFLQNPSMLNATGATTPLRFAYYDTWPFYYEMDGVDQDGVHGIDQGTNGFDDGGIAGVVDDIGEYETSPPYPVPLRGISITVRAIEDGTRQVRQDTIMANFLPK